MRKFKTIDCWLSVTLIIGFCLYSIGWEAGAVLPGYFVVGAWHCTSMITHEWKGWFNEKGTARRRYHQVNLVLFLLTLAGCVFSEILGFLAWILLFAAPLMATYYTSLCFRERYYKMQRPMALLK